MATTLLPPPPPPGARASQGSSWLTGCMIGCGGFLLLCMIFMVIASWWAFKPGRQWATDAIWQDGAIAYFRMDDPLADEGAKAVLATIWRASMEADARETRRNMPEGWEWLANLDRQPAQGDTAGLNFILPSQISVAIVPADADAAELDDSGTDMVAAMNFRLFVRPVKTFIEWIASNPSEGERPSIPHGRFQILDMDRGHYMAFADSTVLMGSSLPALKAALDRVDRGETTTLGVDLPPGRWDLVGHSSNEKGGVERTLAMLAGWSGDEWSTEELDAEAVPEDSVEVASPAEAEEPPVEAAPDAPSLGDADLSWGIDFVSADLAQAGLRLHVADPSKVALWQDELRRTLDVMAAQWAPRGITVDSTLRVEGSVIEGEVRWQGISAAIEQFFLAIAPALDEAPAEELPVDEQPTAFEATVAEDQPATR
jgi:hypothetical protein